MSDVDFGDGDDLAESILVRHKFGTSEWTTKNRAFCRDCDAEVIWCETNKGKSVPVDAEMDPRTDTHTVHFDTCPRRRER